MKKIILFTMLLIFSVSSFSQQTTPSKPVTREDYLKKSKNQKTAAWVLLGGGTVLIGTGFLIGDREESSFDDAATGAILGGIGVLSMIGSIPVFLASGKNKRRANAMSTSIGMENADFVKGYTTVHASYPAISIKIRL